MPNHALIFGASGISGWAITQQALEYPSRATFARVTAITNRPLTHEAAHLPADPRLTLINGIDLTRSPDAVRAALTAAVPDAASATHLFFAAYAPRATPAEDRAHNVALLRTAVTAVAALAPALRHVSLQTGGKWYGIGRPDLFGKLPGPFPESMPRFAPPLDEHIFYYAQHDALAEMCGAQGARETRWGWAEVRPNAIVGFAPGLVFMNTALGLGMYLSLMRATEGPGAEVRFPGTRASWEAPATDCAQDVLARAHLFAATSDQAAGAGPAFNVSDARAAATWADKWAGVCAYFGLKGLEPRADADAMHDPMDEFMRGHAEAWDALAAKDGLVSSGWVGKIAWENFKGLFNLLDWHNGLDTTRIRNAGFGEEIDSVDGYKTAFDRMRTAKQIPA